VKILHPRGPIIGPSYWHLPSMPMVLTSTERHSSFYYFETCVLKEPLCWWQEPHFTGAGCPSATGGSVGTRGAGTGNASQGATWVTVVSASVIGSAAPGDAVPTPRPSGVMSPELLGPSRLCFPDSASSPISWRRVENEAELVYSQVATTEQIFCDTLASVHCNILRLIQVSLRKRKTNDSGHTPSVFLRAHLPSPCIAP
jgi:hypothetical protein